MSKQSELEWQFDLLLSTYDIPYEAEYRFHPTRRWRFDFAIPEKKVAFEVEGGTWTRGRHTRGSGYRNDVEKYNEAIKLGWRLFRVTGDMIKDGAANLFLEGLFHGRDGILNEQ